MSIITYIKGKLNKNTENRGYYFTDEDRERSSQKRLETAMYKQQMKLMQDRLEHLQRLQQQKQMQESIEALESNLYDEEEDETEEESELNPEKLFTQLLFKNLNKTETKPIQTQQNNTLTDENINALIDTIPKDTLKKSKYLTDDNLKAIICQYMPLPSDTLGVVVQNIRKRTETL